MMVTKVNRKVLSIAKVTHKSKIELTSNSKGKCRFFLLSLLISASSFREFIRWVKFSFRLKYELFLKSDWVTQNINHHDKKGSPKSQDFFIFFGLMDMQVQDNEVLPVALAISSWGCITQRQCRLKS